MLVATVVGKADASVKSPGLQGTKLLVVQALGPSGAPEGGLVLALDAVGAGPGDAVAVALGGAAARAMGKADGPCDAAVVAILDHVSVGNSELIPMRRTGK